MKKPFRDSMKVIVTTNLNSGNLSKFLDKLGSKLYDFSIGLRSNESKKIGKDSKSDS